MGARQNVDAAVNTAVRDDSVDTAKRLVAELCDDFYPRLACPIHTARQARQDSPVCVVSGVAV